MKKIQFLLACLLAVTGCRTRHDPSINTGQESCWINPIDGMKYIWVEPGTLALTGTDEPADPMINGHKKIFLEVGFWIGETEVTVGQFRNFVMGTGYQTTAEKDGNGYNWKNPGFFQTENNPVVYTSFEDARAYADWSGVELPTETEWLFACSGNSGTRYYWGDTLDARYLWYRVNSPRGTKPVAQKLPNSRGLYDMVGNAWEYVIICENIFGLRGASWTRCDHYVTRQGSLAENLIGSSVECRLTPCKEFEGHPWDDDRGFRCLKRSLPAGYGK